MFSTGTADSINHVIITTSTFIRISNVGMAPSITLSVTCSISKTVQLILEIYILNIPLHKESSAEGVHWMSWKCSCHLTLSETSTVAHNYHKKVILEEMVPTRTKNRITNRITSLSFVCLTSHVLLKTCSP